MLNMVMGCTVPFPDQLSEGYELMEHCIYANVNAEKILDIFAHFIISHDDDQGFFILELPANKNEENEIRPGVVETTHKHVYYIDALSTNEALAILSHSGDLLINDGISHFGYGFPKTGDEIMLDLYNVVTIYSSNIEQYSDFFKAHEIPRVDKLKMAWSTFSSEHPGITKRIEIDGKSVFDLVEEYKSWGIYKAETRVD